MKCYSKKYNIIFIHLPKAAGTSINTILEISNRGHVDAKRLKTKLSKNIWNNAIKLAVFRNPYDRIYSLYCMRTKKGKKINFDKWFYQNWKCGDRYVWNNQVEMLKDKENNIVTDKILLFENLEEEWKEFAIDNKLPLDLPLLNTTKINKDCKKYFEENQIKRVEKFLEKDLRFYEKLLKDRI